MDLTINNREITGTGELPDNDVIARVLQGEKNLYSIIVRRYNQRLYRVAMSIVNNDSEAEDIMQVAYIKAYENLRQFEFKAGFSTWLTRILINESLLRLKKSKLLVNITDTMMNSTGGSIPGKNVPTPFSSVVNHELMGALATAIQGLPEKYRTVFVMREIENMSVAETGQCLELTEINVKVRLNRAKTMLRTALFGFYQKDEIMHFYLTRCNNMVNTVMAQILVS